MILVENNKIIIDSVAATHQDKNEFKTEFIRLINEGHKEILIDIGKTTNLPSELIGFLIEKKKMYNDTDTSMKIISISDSLKKQFKATRINSFFDLY